MTDPRPHGPDPGNGITAAVEESLVVPVALSDVPALIKSVATRSSPFAVTELGPIGGAVNRRTNRVSLADRIELTFVELTATSTQISASSRPSDVWIFKGGTSWDHPANVRDLFALIRTASDSTN